VDIFIRGIERGLPVVSSPTSACLSQSGRISHQEGKTSEAEQRMNVESEPSTASQIPQRQDEVPSNKIPKWFKPTK
jgi:hypothetical protein